MKKFRINLLLLILIPCMLFFTACGGDKNTGNGNNNSGNGGELATYTVTFMVENSVYETTQVKSGSKIEMPADPVLSNYKFDGWYQNNKKWSFSNNAVISNLTLTAKFDYGYVCQGTNVTAITNYGKTLTELNIAEGMTKITIKAFKDCSNLKSVVIPSSVTIIGAYAFEACTSLTSVTFASNSKLTTIEESAFSACRNLTIMELPSSVKNIDKKAFYECGKLTSLVVPSNVITIGESAFHYCDGLASVTFGENSKLSTIGASAFAHCSKLTGFVIPNNVTSVGKSAFDGCRSLTNMTLPFVGGSKTENTYLGYIFGASAFSSNKDYIPTTLKEVTVTNCTSIGTNAFYNCNYLTKITIPSEVTSIGNGAFSACNKLTSIDIPLGVTTIGDSAFYNCDGLTSVSIPSSVITFGDSIFKNCDGLTSVIFKGTPKITTIGSNAFFECSKLTSISIPSSVTTIGENVFKTCKSLVNVSFEKNSKLKSIGSYTFYDCDGIVSIEIPAEVTSIGDYIFGSCGKLESVTFGTSSKLESIGSYAFFECVELKGIEFPSKLTNIGKYAFRKCNELTSVVFKNANGWSVSTNSNMSNATALVSTELLNNATAIEYLISTYYNYCWQRSGTVEDIFTIIFKNYDGSIISEKNDYSYGDNVEVPVIVPIKPSDEVYSYVFNGWDSEIVAVNGNKVYTAVFTETYINYTITFKNYDETVISEKTDYHYGDRVVVPSNPTKPSDNTYNYTFAGWDKEVVAVNGNRVYKATYNRSYVNYTITFKNYDGTIISEKTNYNYGDNVIIPTTTPTRPSDNVYTYTFNGWDSAIILVNGDKVYTATYSAEYRVYTITYHNTKNATNNNRTSYTYNTETFVIEDILLNGYNFSGWYTDATYTTLADITIEKGSYGNLNFYAKLNEILDYSDGLVYTLAKGGAYYIVSSIGTCTDSDVIIPSVYDGKQVKQIAESAFKECYNLTSVVIPSSVTTIGAYAFSGCRNLTSVEISNSVTTIGKEAFYQCYRLVEVKNLSSLNIVKGSYENGYVSYYALRVYNTGVSYLEKDLDGFVTYNDGEEIYLIDYKGASSEITIPSDVTILGNYSLSFNDILTNVVIPNGVKTVCESTFRACKNLISIEFPSSVTTIGPYMFCDCDNLTTVVIPSTIESIGYYAFDLCDKLTYNVYDNANYLGNSENPYLVLVKSINDDITSCSIHSNTKIINSYAFNKCSKLKDVIFESDRKLESIGYSAFSACTSLTTITIPNSVKTIESYAFNDSSRLASITFGTNSQLEKINNGLFSGCSNLTSVVIPSGVTSIGDFAFSGCGSLTELVLPNAVETIGESAFNNCKKLENIIIPNGIKSISATAFNNCIILNYNNYNNANYLGNNENPYLILVKVTNSTITNCTIHSYTKIIYDYAFSGCSNLTSVEIPNGVKIIGSYAFRNCKNLAGIVIPANVTNIGVSVFSGCTILGSVVFRDTNGWTVSENSDMSNSIQIPNIALSNAAETANYIVSNNYYWQKVGFVEETYSITFKNYDGSIITEKTGYHYGDVVEVPSITSSIPGNDIYEYVFVGWDSEVTLVIGNKVYTAILREQYKNYTVTFKNYDGSIITERTDYHYGDSVIIPSETPSRPSDGTYAYTFAGWDTEVVAVNGNKVYTATYTQSYVNYTITFKNYDGTVISEKSDYHFGDTVVVPSETPSKPSNDIYTYAFAGWDSGVVAVNGNKVYTAVFREQYKNYTVTFKNYDGTIISEKTDYHYGDSVVIPSETPSRPSDGTYAYTFTGWDIEVTLVLGNKVYTATYTQSYVNYTITFKNYDGTVISEKTDYHYGDVVEVPSENPSKPSDETYTYTFAGWDSEVVAVNGNKVYTATFTATKIEKNPSEGLEYTLSEDETYYIVSRIGTCTDTDIIIPKIYNGKPVKEIGSTAFKSCRSLTSIIIPSSVTSIGSYAFSYCRSLTSIEIPSSVTSIGSFAFCECSSLTSITFGENSQLTSIGSYAFYYCSNLTSIEIPSSVTSIGSSAFYDCDGLTSVTFGENSKLESIGSDAFRYCSSLTSIEIPASVTSIGSSAFSYCSSLTSVTFENPNGWKVSQNSDMSDSTLLSSTSLSNAATAATYLTSTYFKYYMYYWIREGQNFSEGLKYTLSSDGTYYIVSGIGTCTDTDIIIPEIYKSKPVKEIGSYAFNFDDLISIEIPTSIESISGYAFDGCVDLISVKFRENSMLKNIYGNSFRGCISLMGIEIPSGVTNIGSNAFKSCRSLTSIEIPSGVISIDYDAFAECYRLVEVKNLSNLNIVAGSSNCGFVGYYAKRVYSSGESYLNTDANGFVTYNNGIDIYLVVYQGTETNIVIPSNVTKINDYAFYKCSSLTSIKIPSGVTSISNVAFNGCSSLKNIEIPSAVTCIGSSVFSGCRNLISITFGDNSQLESIGSNAFNDCRCLTSIVIPKGVKSIGDYAFYRCRSLTIIEIPSTVKSIGKGGFDFLSSLTSVTFENPNGWKVSQNSDMSNSTLLSSTDLSNTLTAATYLTSTYSDYYWCV